MGTALFASDGIDVAALVAEHLGPRLLPAVLIKQGAVAERDPAHPTRAPQRGEPVRRPCRGFIESFSTLTYEGTVVKLGDRKVTLLGDTLGGLVPEGGTDQDRVEIEGGTWDVINVLSRDPAAAAYVLQVRNP